MPKMVARRERVSRTVLIALFSVIVSLNCVRSLKDATEELRPMVDNLKRFNNSLMTIVNCSLLRFFCLVRYRDLSQDRTSERRFDLGAVAMAAYASFYQVNGVTVDDQEAEYAPSPDLGTFRVRDEPMALFGLLPQTVEVLETSFLLTVPTVDVLDLSVHYTKEGQSVGDLGPLFKNNGLEQLYVIVHDWLSLSTEPLIGDLADALLMDTQFFHSGVLIVNWEFGAQTEGVDWTTIPINEVYAQAAVNTVLVGHELGLVLYQMWRAGLVEPRNIHVIGHGLGAHLAHFAAEWFQRLPIIRQELPINLKLGRITGLNPTALGFQATAVREPPNRVRFLHLNEDDASFVDIISANRVATAIDRLPPFPGLLSGGLGFVDITGHVTFYVNSAARLQPFCNSKPPGNFFFGCNQDSSLAYFFLSVRDRLLFREQRRLISVNCETYARKDDCVRRTVEEYGRSPACYGVMGIDAPGEPGRGRQFLDFDPNEVDFVAADLRPAGAAPPNVPQQVNQLINFVRLKRSDELDERATARQVIDRYPTTEQVDNVQLHPEDRANCGLFKTFPGPPPARVIRGELTYRGQFPWTVCIHIMQFKYRSMVTILPNGTELFRRPFPVYTVDKEHGVDGDEVLSGVEQAWRNFETLTSTASGCSGSLIHPQWVVTAAHCFDLAKNGVKMSLAFGGVSCRRPVRRVTVTIEKRPRREQNVFIPEPFADSIVRQANSFQRFFEGECTQERGLIQSGARVGDIALIKLPEPLDIDEVVTWPGNRLPNMALNTICWRSAELFNYPHRKELFASAYGIKGPNATNTGDLNWLKVQIVRRREFLDANKFYLGITLTDSTEGTFNAINLEADPNTLTTWAGKMLISGDSGGPYQWYVAQDNVQNDVVARARAVLVGVTGFGLGIEFTATVFGGVTHLRPSGALMTKAWLDWMVGIVGANTNPFQPEDRFGGVNDPVYLTSTGGEGDYEKP